MFTTSLVTDLNANSGIANMTAYAETFPAPKTTTPSIVGVIPSGESPAAKRDIASYTYRIMVSGSASSAIAKAREIFLYYSPEDTKPAWMMDTRKEIDNFFIMAAFWERRPHLIRNTGNIFIAQTIIRFLAAYHN